MRRLAVDLLLVFGVALALGPRLVVAPVALGVAGLAVAGLAERRLATAAVMALGLGVGAARGHVARGAQHQAEGAAASGAPRRARCAGRAVVVGSPRVLGGMTRLEVEAGRLACDGGELPPLRAVVYVADDPDGRERSEGAPLARGDELDLIAELAPLERFADAELGDGDLARARSGVVRSGAALSVRRVTKGRGVRAWIDRARGRVRSRIDATFAPDAAPMARALVLGETDLDRRDDLAFRTSGLAHLLAVSGMHLVIVVLGLVRALRAALVRLPALAARWDVHRAACAVGVVTAWVYADFAGGSGSALRAAWMLTFALAARAMARRPDATRSFALSLVAMSAVDPLVVADVSFVLSAGATAGLLGLARPLSRALSARVPPILAPAAEASATTVAATVPCAPILATFAPTLPLGGVAANLVAVPFGELAALPLCILHALLSPWPGAERGAARAASGALLVVRGIARTFADARWLSVAVPPPTTAEVALLVVGTTAAIATRGRARAGVVLLAVLATLGAEARVRREGAPRGGLRATFLDVGQGDAAIVDLPDGEAMLIDAGGLVGSPVDVGERVIAPVLRARRRSALALVVLSHPHPDHYGGMATGLAGERVAEVWDTGQGEREGVGGAYAAFLARVRGDGATVRGPGALCGAPRLVGGARVEVLAPCPSHSPDRGPNDNSLVLRVTYGTRSILFVGDAEHEEEADLLRLGPSALHADVLKVGHHGSRTSSGRDFVEAVAPREAVISCGARNRFGHPAPATLGTFAAAGVRVHRTDEEGEVVVRTDGARLSITAPASSLATSPWADDL